MAKSSKKIKYDGIVFHSDDERERAKKFCEQLREIEMGKRQLKVTTFDEYATPGRPLIDILNSSIDDAEYIYISSLYYEKHRDGNFYGNIACYCKLPDKFIVLQTGADCPALPNVKAVYTLRLGTDWNINKFVIQKIRQLHTGISSTPGSEKENQETEVPEVARVAPQPRPAARSSEDDFNSHGNISMAADGAVNDRSPPDSSETLSRPEDGNISSFNRITSEEQREELTSTL